jgi:transposase
VFGAALTATLSLGLHGANGKRHIRAGRYEIRMLLVLAARCAVRFDPSTRTFYERLLAAGKSKMVALVSAARKLLLCLNAMARDNKSWNPPGPA